jgi:F0F1-type ATP synthase assembly protein I
MSTLIAGFAVWGGVGWLLDQWWGTRLMTPIGLIVGMALGVYAVVVRHGRAAPVQRSVGSSFVSTSPVARTTSAAAAGDELTSGRSAAVATQGRDGPPPAGTRRETA